MTTTDDDAPERLAPALAKRAGRACAVVAALAVAGAAISPLTDPASKATHPHGFSFAVAAPGELATEGFLVSVGGLRTLAADAAWLRAYVMWEKSDRGACSAYARLACALAPDNPYFREGYANWLAYDFPHWTIASLGGFSRVPERIRDDIFRADANAALDWLKAEMRRDPEQFRYPMVAGEIVTIKFKDFERAAGYSRQAAETPAAPWSPALRYADWLTETGRLREAEVWFAAYRKRTPPGSRARDTADRWLAWARAESAKNAPAK